MSDKSPMSKTPKAPKAIVEKFDATAPGDRAEGKEDPRAKDPSSAQRTDADASRSEGSHAGAHDDPQDAPHGFHDATIGFFEGVGRAAWLYADAHPHSTLYGILGFVLAVLILKIGLWSTIVIAVFVFVGTIIGRMVDGDSAAVGLVRRLLDGRK